MNALTDQQLLREYATSRSESAFRELVLRHIDLVHSASLRIVRNPHTAEDVTQSVFAELSKEARRLSAHPVLAGWLHRTTRHLSANFIRSETRRRSREQQAIAMNEQAAHTNDAEPAWDELAPHLDAVLGELSDSDRDAILLRFFEKRSAKEIAARLGISAESAQKRVNRAVERLRDLFARRGITSSGAVLTGIIHGNAVQAAPAGLAATVTAGALAGTATTATTISLVMNLFQKMLVPAAILGLAGTWLYQNHEANELRTKVIPAVQRELVPRKSQLHRQADAAIPVGTTRERGSPSPAGGGAGSAVAAGVEADDKWEWTGPDPTIAGMDDFGRPTTVMIEKLELSDEEVATLEAAVRRIRKEAMADFVERVKLKGHGKEQDGYYHYRYHAPARPDRGQHFFDEFTQAFVAAIGEQRGKRFRQMMEEDKFLGGMGRYDLDLDFTGVSAEEIHGGACYYLKPGSDQRGGSFQASIDIFKTEFGDVFDLKEANTFPKIPIRSLPEDR